VWDSSKTDGVNEEENETNDHYEETRPKKKVGNIINMSSKFKF